jgi:hypothetical protein
MDKCIDEKIDIVVMWVDGNDKKWQEEKKKYDPNPNSDSSIYRYRDWNLLQYWFRGVEKFAPWVNKIHFVTWGHIPNWLNTENEKLNIVKHSDFIPEKYLPTFSANTIELNLHRIKGLSDKFILLNDDLYFINNVKPEDFFVGDTPLDTVGLNVHCPKKSLISQYFCINDVSIINEHFDFKKCLKRDWKKWFDFKNGNLLLRTIVLANCPRFPGFYQHHLANAYNKKTFETIWKKEYEILDNTCLNKFRGVNDVNQWVCKEWQIASGNFMIRNIKFGKSFYIDRDGIKVKNEIIKYIKKQKGCMISINDGPMSNQEFNELLKDLQISFEKILPERSSFEK